MPRGGKYIFTLIGLSYLYLKKIILRFFTKLKDLQEKTDSHISLEDNPLY